MLTQSAKHFAVISPLHLTTLLGKSHFIDGELRAKYFLFVPYIIGQIGLQANMKLLVCKKALGLILKRAENAHLLHLSQRTGPVLPLHFPPALLACLLHGKEAKVVTASELST